MIQMSASSKEIKKKERIKTVVPPFNVLATIDISYVLHFVMKLSCTVTCCLNHRAFFWYAAKPEFLVASSNFSDPSSKTYRFEHTGSRERK